MLYVTITGYGYYRVVADAIGVSRKTETMDVVDYVIFIFNFCKVNTTITRTSIVNICSLSLQY